MSVSELSVNELSSSVEETSKTLDVSISRIATTIKLAMGIITIGDIFPNLEGTIKLVCQSCVSQNSFSKLKLSNDGKALIGVMFIGKSIQLNNDCFFVKSTNYKSVLNYKLFSIQIQEQRQRELITAEFNKWFNQFASSINIQFKEFNSKRNSSLNITSCCYGRRLKGAAQFDMRPEILCKMETTPIRRRQPPPAPCSIQEKEDDSIIKKDSLYYHPNIYKEKSLSTISIDTTSRSSMQSPLPENLINKIGSKINNLDNKCVLLCDLDSKPLSKSERKIEKKFEKHLKKIKHKNYTLCIKNDDNVKQNLKINASLMPQITEV